MSRAVEALVELTVAEGNGFDPAAHAREPKSYEMTGVMSPAVREAGENDPALAYAQTIGQETPQEGFVDEADETVIMFPFPPEAIAASRAETAGGTTWQTGFAMIAFAFGGAELYRGVFDPQFDGNRACIGVLFLVVAAALFWRGSRRGKTPARDRDAPPPA